MAKSGEKLIVISNINNILNNKNNYLFKIKNTCQNKKIICFGASIAGKYAVDFFLNNFKSEVLFFIDKDKKKHRKKLNNKKIFPVSHLSKVNKSIPIIITNSFTQETYNQAKKLGFEKILIAPLFGSPIKTEKMFNSKYIINNKKEYIKLFHLMEDNQSKKTLISVLNFRLNGNFENLYKVSLSSKKIYFPKKILKLSRKEIFVDVGAFNGDTIKIFLKNVNNRYNKIYAFEPDIQKL